MESLADCVQVGLVGCPLASLQARSELDGAATVLVVDAVNACHQAPQFALVLGVEHIELDGAAVFDIKCHDTRLAVGISVAPDVVQGMERLPRNGYCVA